MFSPPSPPPNWEIAGVNIYTYCGLGKMMFNFWKLQFKKEVKIVEWKHKILLAQIWNLVKIGFIMFMIQVVSLKDIKYIF